MRLRCVAAWAMTLLVCGCAGVEPDEDTAAVPLGLHSPSSGVPSSGQFLFTKETFGGNDRTCSTCHSDATGTISPDDVAVRYALDPTDPLFRPLDSDDGQSGTAYHRLLDHATILVSITLPPNVTLADDAAERNVTFERTVPSTLDTPALDPVLMWDGRIPTLEDQAMGAILGHAAATLPPAADAIAQIVGYEKEKLFSSKDLEQYAKKAGPPPALPAGSTASEIRGRAFFDPTTAAGLCARCHAGPMLNETSAFGPGGIAGIRFSNARVSAFNARGLPVRTFLFDTPDGVVTVSSPDPGRALVTGNPKDADRFKIPSLRNIKNTAPYFHDGSALTLEEVALHYAKFFELTTKGAIVLSAQDQADIVAYMKLL